MRIAAFAVALIAALLWLSSSAVSSQLGWGGGDPRKAFVIIGRLNAAAAMCAAVSAGLQAFPN
jgi:hypothetical protein